MRLRHVIESQQFSREDLDRLFRRIDAMPALIQERSQPLRGYVSILFFTEQSTRTLDSFASAMLRLGGTIITNNDPQFSSMAKGESWEHTVRVISGYADVLVLRHHEAGSIRRAMPWSKVPLINAGDGPGQHPTQGITDGYTIYQHFDSMDGLTIGLCGDLANGRAVRALAYYLAKYDIRKLYLVAPPVVRMKPDILAYLAQHGVDFEETEDLAAIAPHVDVLYQTRVQKERFQDRSDEYQEAIGKVVVTAELADTMRPHAIIMHPMPIDSVECKEISGEVDHNPRSKYFEQSDNKMLVAMALYMDILG